MLPTAAVEASVNKGSSKLNSGYVSKAASSFNQQLPGQLRQQQTSPSSSTSIQSSHKRESSIQCSDIRLKNFLYSMYNVASSILKMKEQAPTVAVQGGDPSSVQLREAQSRGRTSRSGGFGLKSAFTKRSKAPPINAERSGVALITNN